jgi:hypothetical protein
MEFCEQQKLQKSYEEKIIAEYYKVSNERKEQFREFLFDLNKLLRFDKKIKEICEIIEPIIDNKKTAQRITVVISDKISICNF